MSKLIVSICLFVPALFGQFHNLTTTDDGAVLLFSSSLRLRGANQHPWEKLFRIDAAGLSLYMERDRTVPSEFSYVTNAYRMMRAEFSGDGKVTALTPGPIARWGAVLVSMINRNTKVKSVFPGSRPPYSQAKPV